MKIFIVHKCLFPSAGGCWPGAQSNPLYNWCIPSAAPERRGAAGRGEYLHTGNIYISTYLHIRTPAALTMMQPTAFLTSSPPSSTLSPHCWLFIALI